ncbi:PilW family protein [Effusibacillus consociatus]|uniref:PilW family protein n=1 Tax=Effusibacillus consociatus TaxID=1117041 RepID=A0ABV9Q6J2_9BACL
MRYRMKHWFNRTRLDQRGMTLVELLIGMLVLSLIILAVAGWMSQWGKSAQVIEKNGRLATPGENAFRIVGEDIRVSTAILSSGSELTLRNGSGQKIRYYISDRGKLIRSVNGLGASVIAPDVKKWQVQNSGKRAVQVTLSLEHDGSKWEREGIFSLRGWGNE